jgi:hypothetical protein
MGAPGFPGPGMPPPQPPRSGNGALIAVIVAGAVAVVVLVAVVVVVLASGGKPPEERVTAAANSLGTARTVRLKGSFDYISDHLRGEVTVTRGGRVTGTVDWNGENVTLLAADQTLFVKAPKSYWTGKLSVRASDTFLADGDQWGRVDRSELSLNFDRELSPAALSQKLRQISRYNISERETTVQGRKAHRISSSLYTVYISEDDELLRYESTLSPRVSADVTVPSAADSSAAITQLRGTVDELDEAFDTTTSPSPVGKPEFGPTCRPFGRPCTVRMRFSGPLDGRTSLQIKVNFRLTSGTDRGGPFLGQCSDNGTVTSAGGSSSFSCTISGGEWARSGKNARNIWLEAVAIAMALTPSELSSMKTELSSE